MKNFIPFKSAYFAIQKNLQFYEVWDTKRERELSWYIGETLACMITDKQQPLNLIRMAYDDMTIVVRRRPDSIKLECYARQQ